MTINHLQSTTYKAINVETILNTSCNCNIFIFLSDDQHDWCLLILLEILKCQKILYEDMLGKLFCIYIDEG